MAIDREDLFSNPHNNSGKPTEKVVAVQPSSHTKKNGPPITLAIQLYSCFKKALWHYSRDNSGEVPLILEVLLSLKFLQVPS